MLLFVQEFRTLQGIAVCYSNMDDSLSRMFLKLRLSNNYVQKVIRDSKKI